MSDVTLRNRWLSGLPARTVELALALVIGVAFAAITLSFGRGATLSESAREHERNIAGIILELARAEAGVGAVLFHADNLINFGNMDDLSAVVGLTKDMNAKIHLAVELSQDTALPLSAEIFDSKITAYEDALRSAINNLARIGLDNSDGLRATMDFRSRNVESAIAAQRNLRALAAWWEFRHWQVDLMQGFEQDEFEAMEAAFKAAAAAMRSSGALEPGLDGDLTALAADLAALRDSLIALRAGESALKKESILLGKELSLYTERYTEMSDSVRRENDTKIRTNSYIFYASLALGLIALGALVILFQRRIGVPAATGLTR